MNGNSSSNVHWYQNLDTDSIPVLDASHGTVYYGYDACRLTYSNSELSATPADHDYVNGVCSVCGSYEPAVLITKENRSQFNITDTIFDGYYAITNATDLAWLAEAISTDNGQFKGANAVLTADIDLESISNWSPIGTADSVYAGNFEGQGHSISGMKLNFSSDYQGLFGRTMGATLQNFSVSGTMSTSTGGFAIGGIVGSAEGSNLLNIVSNVNITVAEEKSCTHIAGVAGRAAGIGTIGTSVSLCTYNGTLDAGNSSNCVGGIVGYTNDYCSITNCMNTGNVASCNDEAYIGGILGYVNNDTFKGIKNCLNTGSVSGGNGTDGAICGRYRNAATGEISTGNYFLIGTSTNGVGIIENNKPISATAVTTEQLISGEVCYWLNDSTSTGTLNWYQRLGEDGDSYPGLKLASDSSNIVYYGYDVCYLTYANDTLSSNASDHDYSGLSAADENGLKSYLCAHCHAADSSRSNIRVIENFSNNTNLELKVDSSNCYTTGDVIIADGTLAKFGVDFKAKSVTYKRALQANNGKYSLIVPFDINAEKMAELGTLYQFDHVDSEKEKVHFTSATEVEANKAYYLLPTLDMDSIVMKDSTVVYATSSVYATSPSAAGLYGSYAQMDAPEGAYVYAMQSNIETFVKADADSKINPFRAYLWLNESSMSEALAIFGVEDEVTAINALEAENGSAAIFNLNGQRIERPRQGGIYIQNNKMIIQK